MDDRIVVLNVGHGNCAIVHDGDHITVVDGGRGPWLIWYIDENIDPDPQGVRRIDRLLVSHADRDHIDGAAALLTSPAHVVGEVFVNPDAMRRTDSWEGFLLGLAFARRQQNTKVFDALTAACPGRIEGNLFDFEIVSPTPEMSIRGAGGRGQSPNTASAVVRITRSGQGEALLAADMDATTLRSILSEPTVADLRANLLVFPHHGGKPGTGDEYIFSAELTALVEPKRIVFSIGRHFFENPRPLIVEGARSVAPMAHIACTQLSKRCQREPARLPHGDHCAGTVEFRFGDKFGDGVLSPSLEAHSALISDVASNPMCQ